MQFMIQSTDVGKTLEECNDELIQFEFNRISERKQQDANLAEIDRKFHDFYSLIALKNAIVCHRVDDSFLRVFDDKKEISDMLGFPIMEISNENFNEAHKLLSLNKVEGALESWGQKFMKLLDSLIEALVEMFQDIWNDNRRYRFQLQTHAVGFRTRLLDYCRGDQSNFGEMVVAVYHCQIWRGLLQAATNIANTYPDVNLEQENYVNKHRNVLELNFALFGRVLTPTGVTITGNVPDRRPYKLSNAQWNLNNMGPYCESTVRILKDDQVMTKASDAILAKLKAARKAIKDDKEQAMRLKRQADFFRSVMRNSSDMTATVARSLLLICNAAKRWTPPKTQ